MAGAFLQRRAEAADAPQRPGDVITLEQAYDLALASDQAIRIAFVEVRKAKLLPWSAVTRLGPRLSGSASYDRREVTTSATALETSTTTVSGVPTITTRSVDRTDHTRNGAGALGISFEQPLIDLTVFPANGPTLISPAIVFIAFLFSAAIGVFFGLYPAKKAAALDPIDARRYE